MKICLLAAAAALIAAPALASPSADQPGSREPVQIALDTTQVVNGVEIGCTGIGQTKLDPRWKAFPVRVEFSNAKAEYLANSALTLFDQAGHAVASVSCDGPWILMKLNKGTWRVEGWAPGSSAASRKVTVKPPPSGQSRVVLQFPDA